MVRKRKENFAKNTKFHKNVTSIGINKKLGHFFGRIKITKNKQILMSINLVDTL